MEDDGERYDDNADDEGMAMVEMSQDCMIEWDESRNLDLRQIIAKSPHVNAATATATATPRSRRSPRLESSSSKRRSALSPIKRRLEKNDESFPVLQTQPPPSSSKKPKKNHAEQEIDAIYSILQKEDEAGLGGPSPHSAPTQRFEHRHRRILDSRPTLPSKRMTTSSLASRHHRRRRREAGHNQRQPPQSISAAADFTSPIPSTTNDYDNDDDDNEGVFESLLKQMSTPQPETPPPPPPSRAPLLDVDKNVVDAEAGTNDPPKKYPTPMQQQARPVIHHPLNHQAVSTNMNAVSTEPYQGHSNTSQSKHHPVPGGHKDQGQSGNPLVSRQGPTHTQPLAQRIGGNGVVPKPYPRGRPIVPQQQRQSMSTNPYAQQPAGQRIVANPNNTGRPLVPPQSSTLRSQPLARQTTGPSIVPNSNGYQRPVPPKLVNASSASRNPQRPQHTQQMTNQPTNNSSIHTKVLPPASRQSCPNDKQSMPPPPPPNGISNNNVNNNMDTDDDEFGDLDLSADDMANLDSLLSITSSQQPLPQPKSAASSFHSNTRPPLQPKSIPKWNHPKPTPVQPTKPITTVPSNTSKVQQKPQDDFGDFPDIDFDAIDQVISQRSTQQPLTQQHSNRPRNSNAPNANLAAVNGVIRNPKNVHAETDPSFITFSRYKVVNVTNDTTNWTKTLTVAAWTDAMLNDEAKEKKIHRNCQVTLSDDLVQQDGFGQTSNVDYPISGCLHLRGEWYHTPVNPGDVAHLCSLKGQYRTDVQALPITLHTAPPLGSDTDDLVLIIHPDMLMTPTTVSEAVTCPRRAVLKSRLGSTGLSSKAPLIGTMRHALFGLCMEENNFDEKNVRRNAKNIVRQNSESLVGIGLSSTEAVNEVYRVLPIIKQFAKQYTTMGHDPKALLSSPRAVVESANGYQSNIRFLANSVHSTEEPIISHELALKGNVDAVFETKTEILENQNHFQQKNVSKKAGPKHSLMSLELKTGHIQSTQKAHMAQLALYTLMLQVRYGSHQSEEQPCSPKSDALDPKDSAAPGGILLYLNHESTRSVHISPLPMEVKSLIGQRNLVASQLMQASRPRGIALAYNEDSLEADTVGQKITLLPATPAELPDVLPTNHSCKRCYANRECMLYAATVTDRSDPSWSIRTSHSELMSKFTGHLIEEDIKYFRDWDRLIDLEAHAMNNNLAVPWLTESQTREKETGESVSSLVYDRPEPLQGSRVLMVFRRSEKSHNQSSLDSLSLSRGCHVVISTDGTSFDGSQSDPKGRRRRSRHRMHIVRGIMEQSDKAQLFISARREDLERIRDLVGRHQKLSASDLLFRVDKDKSPVGIGTLRQNLITFFTADYKRSEGEELSQTAKSQQRRLPWLRDVVVRLRTPSFDDKTSESLFRGGGPNIPGCNLQVLSNEFAKLNPDQQKAVEKVMNAKDCTMIQGLPGTGKTSTLAFIARLLAARGKRVLITSYTHSAVDNVMLKLMEAGLGSSDTMLPKLVRIGQTSSCHRDVRPLVVSELAVQMDSMLLSQNSSMSQSEVPQDNPTANSLMEVISSAQIVCASALTIPRSPLLVKEHFDVVIIDEAGQISQPAILGALMAADSFVLVGDHKQLPPLVNSEIAESGGYGVSMLKRLADKHPESVAPLTYQYRMHETICRLSSEAVYGGRLKCGNDAVRTQILDLPGFPSRLPQAASKGMYSWLKGVIDPEKSVVFVDTDNVKTNPQSANDLTLADQKNHVKKVGMEALERTIGGRASGSITNPTEATLVRIILNGLFSAGLAASSVGVISPFRAQLRILEDNATIASWKKEGLELSTIDRYQGRDKPVIVLSLVRSNPQGRAGRLLQDMRRLNVALTRAKCKLIIVGSFSTLKTGSDRLRPILARINKRGQRFLLPENAAECYIIP